MKRNLAGARARESARAYVEGREARAPVPAMVRITDSSLRAFRMAAHFCGFFAGRADAEAEFAIERAEGQRQLDHATALMREAADLFRSYERHHRTQMGYNSVEEARQYRGGADVERVKDRLAKAERNALAAARLEAWLRGESIYPITAGGEYVAHAQFRQPPVERHEFVHDQPGLAHECEEADRQTQQMLDRTPGRRIERFANRDGYGGSNVRPVTAGPLAEPGVADGIASALGLDEPGKALAMAGETRFQLVTADPRFDPHAPLCVNGYPFNPATTEA